MTISEQIEILFDLGVVAINIGKPPPGTQAPQYYAKAIQGFNTPGGTGNCIEISHQVAADTVGETLRRLGAQADTAYKLKAEKGSGIVAPRGKS